MGRFVAFISKIKDVFTSDDVKNRAEVLEDVLHGKGSATDIEALNALATLITALCNNKTAGVVHGGVFIFYKIKNEAGDFVIFYKRLTVQERILINRRPTLLQDPYKLLENIEAGIAIEAQQALKLREIAKQVEMRKD